MAGEMYRYPDYKDKMTAENIKKIELYPGYWTRSEENALKLIKKIIKNKSGRNRFLDAGCGEGRLIPAFEGQFDEIVAIDPDHERLNMAADLVRNRGLSKKTTLKQSAIEDFENDRFDFILCSHVLQHVHTASVPVILKRIRDLIKDDGLLCITTCHSIQNNGYFVKESINDSEHPDEPIDEIEFNSLVNSKDILPVHFFSFIEIKNLLGDNGFKIIKFRVFHLDKVILGYENDERIDDRVNSDPYLQETNGLDMMIAAMPIKKEDEMIKETTYQNNSKENLLNFKEAYMGIFYAFSMDGIENEDSVHCKDTALKKINDYAEKHLFGGLIAEWKDNEDYAKDFKYAEEFHLKNQMEKHTRVKLNLPGAKKSEDQLAVNMPFPNDAHPDRRFSIPIEVFLSIYPDNEIGILFFNIKLLSDNQKDNTINADDIIFIIHSIFEDRFKIKLNNPDCLKKLGINGDKRHKMDDIIKKYEDIVCSVFGIKKGNKSIKKRVLEICDSGDGLNLIAAEEFLKRYPGQAYGLMVGDEGWSFVPRIFSRSRIKNRWGSRDFVSIIASSYGVVSVNFRNTSHHKAYEDMQSKLKKERGEKVEDNLIHKYSIAGMEHGLFICLEKAIITRLLLNQENDKLIESIKESDSISTEFLDKRFRLRTDGELQNKIINNSKNLSKLSSEIEKISEDLKIWEIEKLYENIYNSMDIDRDLNKIAERLATHMESLSQLYTLMTNKIVSHFNNRGIYIGIASIVIGAILAAIGYYISGAQIYLDLPGHNVSEGLSLYFRQREARLIEFVFNGSIWGQIISLFR